MAKKESPQIDENFMREMISEGIPRKRENATVKPEIIKDQETENVEITEHATDEKAVGRNNRKKKETEDKYEDIYFRKIDFSDRQITTITRDTHQKLSHIVSMLGGKTGTIGSYIENILRKHFEMHRDEINALCESKSKKPL